MGDQRKRKGRNYVSWTETVDVEIDLAEFLGELSDEDLAEHGLMRVGDAKAAPTGGLLTPISEHKWAVAATRKASA